MLGDASHFLRKNSGINNLKTLRVVGLLDFQLFIYLNLIWNPFTQYFWEYFISICCFYITNIQNLRLYPFVYIPMFLIHLLVGIEGLEPPIYYCKHSQFSQNIFKVR